MILSKALDLVTVFYLLLCLLSTVKVNFIRLSLVENILTIFRTGKRGFPPVHRLKSFAQHF